MVNHNCMWNHSTITKNILDPSCPLCIFMNPIRLWFRTWHPPRYAYPKYITEVHLTKSFKAKLEHQSRSLLP